MINVNELETKRDELLYGTYNKIVARKSRELSKTWGTTAAEAIEKTYEGAFAILSGKVNSLDFVIGSLRSGTTHAADIWTYELNRALS